MRICNFESKIADLADLVLHVEAAANGLAVLNRDLLADSSGVAQEVYLAASELNLLEEAAMVSEIHRLLSSVLSSDGAPSASVKDALLGLMERLFLTAASLSNRGTKHYSMRDDERLDADRSAPVYTFSHPAQTECSTSKEQLHADRRLFTAENVAAIEPVGGLAKGLLRFLRSAFRDADRVCLTQRLGRSNELMIVDCEEHPARIGGPMRPGDRCFVSPDSSLFSLGADSYRVFGDARRVAASFSDVGKPVQSAIGRINKLGFRSGLCLPLSVGEHGGGYLFVNSRRVDAFAKLTGTSWFHFVAAQAMARAALVAARPSILLPPISNPLSTNVPHCGAVFEPGSFQALLSWGLRDQLGMGRGVIVTGDARREFLYSRPIVGAVVVKLIQHTGVGAEGAEIRIRSRCREIRFSCRPIGIRMGPAPRFEEDLLLFIRQADAVGVRVEIGQEGADVVIPHAPAFGVVREKPYSVCS